MGYDIDFLPVGDKTTTGDAIAVRFGNLHGDRSEQTVIIIDGGFQESGEKMVNFIQDVYKTNEIDLVISTHPDQDHSSGLQKVLENLFVKKLWMHKPWDHADEIKNMFVNGKVTEKSIREDLKKSLEEAKGLEALANKKGILIEEPFAGKSEFNGQLLVLSPTENFYNSMLPAFRCLPEVKEEKNIFTQTIFKAEEIIKRVAESLHIETLDDEGETSAENETSTVLLLSIEGKNLLFTADAGQLALNKVVALLKTSNFDFASLDFVQVPHHGSHRNIGPTLLNDLIGIKLSQGSVLKHAIASTPTKEDIKHPSKKVTNAFNRRGAPVHTTQGAHKCHSCESPNRGWQASVALPLYQEVEE
ncbi:MAG: MBL fold metallo-hydrolase [bacterium]